MNPRNSHKYWTKNWGLDSASMLFSNHSSLEAHARASVALFFPLLLAAFCSGAQEISVRLHESFPGLTEGQVTRLANSVQHTLSEVATPGRPSTEYGMLLADTPAALAQFLGEGTVSDLDLAIVEERYRLAVQYYDSRSLPYEDEQSAINMQLDFLLGKIEEAAQQLVAVLPPGASDELPKAIEYFEERERRAAQNSLCFAFKQRLSPDDVSAIALKLESKSQRMIDKITSGGYEGLLAEPSRAPHYFLAIFHTMLNQALFTPEVKPFTKSDSLKKLYELHKEQTEEKIQEKLRVYAEELAQRDRERAMQDVEDMRAEAMAKLTVLSDVHTSVPEEVTEPVLHVQPVKPALNIAARTDKVVSTGDISAIWTYIFIVGLISIALVYVAIRRSTTARTDS